MELWSTLIIQTMADPSTRICPALTALCNSFSFVIEVKLWRSKTREYRSNQGKLSFQRNCGAASVGK